MNCFLSILIFTPLFSFCQIQEFDILYSEIEDIYSIQGNDTSLIETNYLDTLGQIVKKLSYKHTPNKTFTSTDIYHYTDEKEVHFHYNENELTNHDEIKYQNSKIEITGWSFGELDYKRIFEFKDEFYKIKQKDILYEYSDDSLNLVWLNNYIYDEKNNLISYFDSTITNTGFIYSYDSLNDGTKVKTTEVYNNFILTQKEIEYKTHKTVYIYSFDKENNKFYKSIEHYNNSGKILRREEYNFKDINEFDFFDIKNSNKGLLSKIKIYKYKNL